MKVTNEFMLLIRNEKDSKSHFSAEQNRQFLKACEAYISRLVAAGKFKIAQPLLREGKMITNRSGAWEIGPFDESKEVIVGYYHILADDLDEAIEIAKSNPEFEYTTTARVEVRPIKMKEEETGYVYPGKGAGA